MPAPRRPKRSFFPPKPARKSAARPPAERGDRGERGWDPVAAWYDQLVGKDGSDYHRHVVLPAAMDLFGDLAGKRVLDVCCGQGVLIPLLLEKGAAAVTGLDASERLIASARSRFGGEPRVRCLVGDACAPGEWADGSYDVATSIMAIHDVPDLAGKFANVAAALRPGGEFVAVFLHPCFRIPRQTHWGWDEGRKLQYRRIDRYGVNLEIPIVTHPGKGQSETTAFYHRPLGEVLDALGRAGLGMVRCLELSSHRRSQAGGPRSKAEHRAAKEFPMFLALKAVRLGGEGVGG